MYNSELKTRFVRDYTTSVEVAKVCESIFNRFEPYECAWNADLCTKTAQDLQPIIDTIVGLRERSKWKRINILRDYVKWCISVSKVPGACDGMLQINSVGLYKVKKQTVANPTHLQKYLNLICQPESNKTTDNIYRCYYWLAYGGVSEEDILSVKCSDVDLQNMVVHYRDTDIPIYNEALPAFKNCVELTQFVYNHPGYSNTVWKERVEGDTLVRGIRANLSLYSLRVEISRRAKKNEEKTGLRLSYFRTWISGVFYRTYMKELAGDAPSFGSVAMQQMDGKTYKLASGRNTPEAKKKKIIKDYTNDYERWKLAFKV